jgi:hypothetical protein
VAARRQESGSWLARLNWMGEITRTRRIGSDRTAGDPMGIQNMRPPVAVLHCEIMGVMEIDRLGDIAPRSA